MTAKQPAAHISTWSEDQLEEFHRLYALRSQIAGFAARQAAARVRGGASASALEKAYCEMHAAAEIADYQIFLIADMEFHNAISDLAAVPALATIWSLLEREIKPFAGWAHRELFRDLVFLAEAHEIELETIRSGDEDAAERAAHINLDCLWHMLAEQAAEPSGEADPVESVCGYVLLNLHRKLSFSFVAREVAHLSVGHFSKLFRQARGESFGSYVQNLRMRRAEAMLRSGQHEVGEIALRVGYSDTSRFGEHFKRAYGVAPSEYLRKPF